MTPADAGDGARRVLRTSAMLGIAKLLERGTGFIIAILVATRLGADGLGVYAAAWAIYGLVTIAADAGTSNFLTREASRDASLTASYTVHLSVIAACLAAALVLVAELGVPLLGYSEELETAVSVVLLAIVPRVVNGVQEAVFVTYGRVGFETLTRLAASLAYVLTCAVLLADGRGVPVLLTVLTGTEICVAVVYFVLINRFIVRLSLHFEFALAFRLVREVKSYAASAVMGALFSRPEVVVLSVLAAEREIGLYSAAVRLAELPLLVSEVMMTSIFPMLAQTFGAAEERYAAWQTASVRLVLAFSLPVAACLFAGADEIVGLVFGAEFGAAAPLLRLLAPGLVFLALFGIFWRSLVARGRQNVNVALQAMMVGVRLAAGVLLIALLAATGAAVAATATAGLHLVLVVRATARSGAPPAILHNGWRFGIAAVAAGLCVSVLSAYLTVVLALAAGGLVYLVAAVLIGAVTPDDRLLLRKLRRSHLVVDRP